MSSRWSATPAQRAQRKQDLLMASRLVRLHAGADLDRLGDTVDGWAGQVERVRQWVRPLAARPGTSAVLAAVAIGAAALWRRVGHKSTAAPSARWLRLWSAGWTAWRLWRAWVGLQRRRG